MRTCVCVCVLMYIFNIIELINIEKALQWKIHFIFSECLYVPVCASIRYEGSFIL